MDIDKSRVVVLKFEHDELGPSGISVACDIEKKIKDNNDYVLKSLFSTATTTFTTVFLHFSKP